MKKILSVLLAATMIVGIIPISMFEIFAASDDLIWPCESSYYVTCMYYYKDGSKHGSRYGYNKAIDIAGGGNIIAAESGTVELATDVGNTSFGKYVVIKHASGEKTLYGHLSSYCVSVGQIVSKGQKIGVMGSTGNSTGTHLHFEYSGGDPWKMYFNSKYASNIVFEQNVRSNNSSYNSDKTIVNVIDSNYHKNGTYYYYSGEKVCDCSTSYAGEYTTYNVSSVLNVRDTHSASGNVVTQIPANAIFDVSKGNGKWAHVTYNNVSGYVSMEYIQQVTEYTIDTRYPVQFRAYTYENAKQPAYDAVNGNNIGNIYTSDEVIIQNVYTNGWVKALCPWTGYSNGRQIYAPLSTFLNTSYTPKTARATVKTLCYYRKDLSSSPGYIYVDDVCVIVGESGDYYQVLCPWDWGYYLVWGHKSAFEHTHSFGSWTNYNTSCHTRICDCGADEWQDHSWNAGVVSKQPTCTSNGIKIYTCKVCGGTKTEEVAKLQHSYTAGDYTEPNHPHRIYNTSACCEKKDSGYKAKVSSCTQCYPAPVISGIVSSENEVFVGDTVTFTLKATGATEYDIAIGDGVNVLLEKKQSSNSLSYTFTKEGTYHIWGYAYNGEIYSSAQVLTITVKKQVILSSLTIATKPTKIVYEIGESLNTSGLILKLTYSDGSTKNVTSGFTVSGFSSETAGNKTVTVSYGGKTTSFAVTVNEAVTSGGKYQISDAEGTAGSTVEVYLSIEDNPGIISLRNTISYDTSALELIEVEDIGLLIGYTIPSATITSPYTLRWVDSLAAFDTTANGRIAKFTFKIKENAEIGEYGISVTHVEARNSNGTKVVFDKATAYINVIDYISGDIDGDGEISDWDAILLNRYLAGWNVNIELAAADVDRDGEISDWDAITLERYLAGWEIQLKK